MFFDAAGAAERAGMMCAFLFSGHPSPAFPPTPLHLSNL